MPHIKISVNGLSYSGVKINMY